MLAAIIANDEQEFLRVMDSHCRQVLALHLDGKTEIAKVTKQIRETEASFGLQHHAATLKMVLAAMTDRLMPNDMQRLAA